MDFSLPTFQRLACRDVPLPLIWRRPTIVQRQSLLRLIAVATENNVPLTPLLEHWAEDERGFQRTRIRKLVALLKGGRSLPDAIEEVHGVLSDEELLAIRFDSQMGTRTSAVRQLIGDETPSNVNPTRQIRGDLVYVVTVIAAAMLIVPFLHLKIVPVFQKIMLEFSVATPPAFNWSIELARFFVAFWWLFTFACLVIGWCLVSTKAGRFVRHSILDRWLRPFRQQYAADVLTKLQIATAVGRPIPGALSTLARYHFAPQVRHKLLFVRNEVEQGAEVWQSLATVDLISGPELRLLRTAEGIGNRPWVLKQLATIKSNRIERRLDSFAQWMLPALVLLLGAFVLSQALMVFQPLVRMIEGLL